MFSCFFLAIFLWLYVCVYVCKHTFLFCFEAYDYPVICHQTVSLQLFDLHLCDFCCLLIIIDFSTVLPGIFLLQNKKNLNRLSMKDNLK